MRSADSPTSRPLALFSQLASYPEWLKIEAALRLVLTHPWSPKACRRYASTSRGYWRSGAGWGGRGGSIDLAMRRSLFWFSCHDRQPHEHTILSGMCSDLVAEL